MQSMMDSCKHTLIKIAAGDLGTYVKLQVPLQLLAYDLSCAPLVTNGVAPQCSASPRYVLSLALSSTRVTLLARVTRLVVADGYKRPTLCVDVSFAGYRCSH